MIDSSVDEKCLKCNWYNQETGMCDEGGYCRNDVYEAEQRGYQKGKAEAIVGEWHDLIVDPDDLPFGLDANCEILAMTKDPDECWVIRAWSLRFCTKVVKWAKINISDS